MTTAETRTTLAAFAALSVLLVLVIGAVAVVTSRRGDGGASSDGDPLPAGPDRAYPGPQIQIDDRERPLRVGCVRATGTDGGYAVAITNLGSSTLDYRVTVDLVDDDGASTQVTVEVPALEAGEEREVAVPSGALAAESESCAVAVVESDRRLLLAGS